MLQGFKNVAADLGRLWLRLFCGAGIAYHGYQKFFVYGISNFTEGVSKLGLPLLSPTLWAWAAALAEFGGGLLIIVGLFTRFAALSVVGVMVVAFFLVHADDPFKDKEIAMTYFAMAGALVIMGGGRFSLGRKLFKRKKKE